ncbi:MAG: oligosaccharide flippase family protein [Acutalibacteraceae bacterium]|nr:oligosaccharide flippase family protein [Acutalibacteraceae bacterium]
MLNNLKKVDKKSKVLLQNTFMLYVLQFSSYLFSFITVPYQTRILGPELYGILGVAAAVMLYFQLFLDFGFLLSATEDISKNREDTGYVNRKITTVAVIKAVLGIISLIIMLILLFAVKEFSRYKAVYLIYFAAYAVNSFVPDYVYRGIEKMTAVTLRTVSVKFLFCLLTFIFLKGKEDYIIVPLLLLLGNCLAVVIAYLHLFKKLGYRFTKVTVKEIISDFKRSSVFFYSRIATTVYSATNTVVLGFFDKTGIITGYFTSADKIVTTAKNGFSPISDSLYPYMVRHKDFKPVRKILSLIMLPIVIGCILVGVFSEPLCIFAFGKEFTGAAPILRAFLPAVAVILPSYIFGFPVMGAMGISKYANYSIFTGTAVHIIGILIIALTGNINGVTLAAMTSVSEWTIFMFRITAVYKHRHLFKGETK